MVLICYFLTAKPVSFIWALELCSWKHMTCLFVNSYFTKLSENQARILGENRGRVSQRDGAIPVTRNHGPQGGVWSYLPLASDTEGLGWGRLLLAFRSTSRRSGEAVFPECAILLKHLCRNEHPWDGQLIPAQDPALLLDIRSQKHTGRIRRWSHGWSQATRLTLYATGSSLSLMPRSKLICMPSMHPHDDWLSIQVSTFRAGGLSCGNIDTCRWDHSLPRFLVLHKV